MKKKSVNYKKKIVAVTLSVAMIGAMSIPMISFAEDGVAQPTTSDGEVKTINQVVFFEDENGTEVGKETFKLTEGIHMTSELTPPEGYELVGNPTAFTPISGSENAIMVIVRAKAGETPIEKIRLTVKFVDAKSGQIVAWKDTKVEKAYNINWSFAKDLIPAGYELAEVGDVAIPEDGNLIAKVNKLPNTIKLKVSFVDEKTGEAVSKTEFDVEKSNNVNSSEFESKVPDGYILVSKGDVAIPENGELEVLIRKEAKPSEVEVTFKNDAGRVIAKGTYIVDEDGDGIFNTSEINPPNGYKAHGGGDHLVTEKDIVIPVDKIVNGTIIKAMFIDKDGNVIAAGDYFVDPDDDGIADFSELEVPDGYELTETGTFFVSESGKYAFFVKRAVVDEGTQTDDNAVVDEGTQTDNNETAGNVDNDDNQVENSVEKKDVPVKVIEKNAVATSDANIIILIASFVGLVLASVCLIVIKQKRKE